MQGSLKGGKKVKYCTVFAWDFCRGQMKDDLDIATKWWTTLPVHNAPANWVACPQIIHKMQVGFRSMALAWKTQNAMRRQ